MVWSRFARAIALRHRGVRVAVCLLPLGLLLAGCRPQAPTPETPASASSTPIRLACAASNRGVIEAITADYREATGQDVVVDYGASQTLLTSISLTGQGDLYLPADDSYLDQAREQGLIEAAYPLARMRIVVVIRADDPREFRQLQDLCQPDVRLVQANPDAAAIGRLTREALSRTPGLWDQLANATVSFKGTVNEVANDVAVGAADAGIVFDVVARAQPKLRAISLPELNDLRAQVSIGVVKGAHHPDTQGFLDFLRYPDHGLRRYREFGFEVAETPTQ